MCYITLRKSYIIYTFPDQVWQKKAHQQHGNHAKFTGNSGLCTQMCESCKIFRMLYNTLNNIKVHLCSIISIVKLYEKNFIAFGFINDCTCSQFSDQHRNRGQI